MGMPGFARYVDPVTKQVSKLIFFGGMCISGKQMNEIWCLDVNTLTWSVIPTSSKAMVTRAHHTNCIVGTKFIVYGGTDETMTERMEPHVVDSMYSFDLEYFLNAPQVPNNWMCRSCKAYTKKKCSQCNEVPVCSETCEEGDHAKTCAGNKNTDDVVLQKFFKNREQYQMLEKQQQESSALLANKQERLKEMELMYKKTMQMLQAKESDMQLVTSMRETLEHSLTEKDDLVKSLQSQIGNASKQSDKQKKQLELQLEQAKQEKQVIESTMNKNKNHVTQLEKQLNQLKSNLQQTENALDEKVSHLQNQLSMNKQELQKQTEEVAQTKQKYEDMKDKLKEAESFKDCPICMENVKDRALSCGHVLCASCVQVQKDQFKSKCPYCSQVFTHVLTLYF